MKKNAFKIFTLLLTITVLFNLTACGSKKDNDHNNSNIDLSQEQDDENDSIDVNYTEDYNTHGDFQSSLFGMAIEGDWIFYRNYFDRSQGIRKTLVEGGEYGRYNVETVFNPSKYVKQMAEKIGWDNTDFYEHSDIASINNLQVVNNWVYWASDCAIWRFPNLFDAEIFDLELIAVIGIPERPTCTNFYVDGDWIYYACNAIEERYDSSTALIEHSLCKLNLNTKKRTVLASSLSTNESLGEIQAYTYDNYKFMDLKAVCDDGRIYFSDYTKDYILYYKDGKVYETDVEAGFVDSYKYVKTQLCASKNGNIVSAFYAPNAETEYYYYTDEKLSDCTSIDNCDFVTDDGYYYASYIHDGVFPDYDGFYKCFFNGETKKITNDHLYLTSPLSTEVVGVCGDHLYYYTKDKNLCRMDVNGGNWEDLSWMINNF